jgi:hypothetical protein
VRIDPFSQAAGEFSNPGQLAAKFFWRPCTRLCDVDFPVVVQCVGDVHPNTCELIVFLLAPTLNTHPIARNEEPMVAVDVESLVCIPPAQTRRRSVRVGIQFGEMGKYERFNFNGMSLEAEFFWWKPLCCGFVAHKRVPGFDGFAVKRKFDRRLARHHAVEYGSEVVSNLFRAS